MSEYWEPKPKQKRGDSREEQDEEVIDYNDDEDEDEEGSEMDASTGAEDAVDEELQLKGQLVEAFGLCPKKEQESGEAPLEPAVKPEQPCLDAGAAGDAAMVETCPENEPGDFHSGLTDEFAAMKLDSPGMLASRAEENKMPVEILDSPAPTPPAKKPKFEPDAVEDKKQRLLLLKLVDLDWGAFCVLLQSVLFKAWLGLHTG